MTKMVQLSDEAYRRLRSRKHPGESFSDVVVRLAGDEDLSGIVGLRTPAEIRRDASWLDPTHARPSSEGS